MKIIFTLIIFIISSSTLSAVEQYRITLLRASPGNFKELINEVKAYRESNNGDVSIMRHSQGDHWDLMLLEPAGKNPLQTKSYNELVDFQHNFLAHSETKWQQIKHQAETNNTYHIEMFHAVHGKAKALLEQRHMENTYLAATQQQTNVVFQTTFGSDVDCFTIGYHKDLSSFASTPDLANEVFEQAAKDAGFKDRADLSFYLRKLILSHHDTLATAVD